MKEKSKTSKHVIYNDEKLSLEEFKGYLLIKRSEIYCFKIITFIVLRDPDLDIKLEMEAFISFDHNLNGQLDYDEIHEFGVINFSKFLPKIPKFPNISI